MTDEKHRGAAKHLVPVTWTPMGRTVLNMTWTPKLMVVAAAMTSPFNWLQFDLTGGSDSLAQTAAHRLRILGVEATSNEGFVYARGMENT